MTVSCFVGHPASSSAWICYRRCFGYISSEDAVEYDTFCGWGRAPALRFCASNDAFIKFGAASLDSPFVSFISWLRSCRLPVGRAAWSRLRARAPRGKTIINRFLTPSVSLRYPPFASFISWSRPRYNLMPSAAGVEPPPYRFVSRTIHR